MTNIKTKVILVGVGGASCSGKSTLVKHLESILPDSTVIRQDDFYLQKDMLPTLQGHDVKNWDVPSAIDWSRMAKVLQVVKCSGSIPSDHVSRDDWHDAGDIPIDADRASSWKARFEDLRKHSMAVANIRVVWVLVEGFMLYWDQVCKFLIKEIMLQRVYLECQNVACQLDICTLLRLPEAILKGRRYIRNQELLAAQSHWNDPEGYWDNTCYPGYIETHKHLFKDGDVESGAPREDLVKELLLIEPEAKETKMDMIDIVEVCLEKIASYSAVISDRAEI